MSPEAIDSGEDDEMTVNKIVKYASEILLVLLLVDFIFKPIANGYNHMVFTATMINKLYHRRKI